MRASARLIVALVFLFVARPALAGTMVTFDMGARGTIDIDLFDDLAPDTVTNFLAYVNAGRFQSTLVHRSTHIADSGIDVIQGGEYTYDLQSASFSHIPLFDPIALEAHLDQKRGIVSMARSANPDSNTSGWFINVEDNPVLNVPNNQYSAFGWVVGTGMSVVDAIHDLPKQFLNGFSNVPVQNYTPPGPVTAENLIFTDNISVTVADHPSFQNPWMHVDVINDGVLKPSDALAIINDLLANGVHAVDEPFGANYYLDVNGNNVVSPSDVLTVINALLQRDLEQSVPAPGIETLGSAPLVVPEPPSSLLACLAVLACGLFVLGRKRPAVG